MRVESDLLLLGASLVEGLVRVQVTALRVEVSQGDLRSEKNISGLVSNKSGVLQGVLELGGHERSSITSVDKAQEVHGKHCNVEGNGDTNEEGSSPAEVSSKGAGGDTEITKGPPQVPQSHETHPGDGEKTVPLNRGGSTESQSRQEQVSVPGAGEGGLELKLLEEVHGESQEEDKGRIKQNVPRFSDKRVLNGKQSSTKEASGGSAAGSLEGQVCEGHGCDTENSRVGSHGNVGNVGGQVVNTNGGEFKLAVIASQPADSSEEHLSKRRVDIHEEPSNDVFSGKTTKVDFVEDHTGGLPDVSESGVTSKERDHEDEHSILGCQSAFLRQVLVSGGRSDLRSHLLEGRFGVHGLYRLLFTFGHCREKCRSRRVKMGSLATCVLKGHSVKLTWHRVSEVKRGAVSLRRDMVRAYK